MFGTIKLKPFIQKSETGEEEDQVNTLVCYSPPGVPGASVQVYVKDGDKSSSAQYFSYVFKAEKEVEKTKVDDYTAQVVRDLATKYMQLEQVVMSALSQNNGNYKGDFTVMSFVLKNVLMEIFHAKAVIQDLENGKNFLEKGVYEDPTKLQVEGHEKKKQTIVREINGRKVYFDIMADPATIKRENLWPRVIAIFVTGYNHQFQGWPDGDKVSILLNKKRGFFG